MSAIARYEELVAARASELSTETAWLDAFPRIRSQSYRVVDSMRSDARASFHQLVVTTVEGDIDVQYGTDGGTFVQIGDVIEGLVASTASSMGATSYQLFSRNEVPVYRAPIPPPVMLPELYTVLRTEKRNNGKGHACNMFLLLLDARGVEHTVETAQSCIVNGMSLLGVISKNKTLVLA